MEHYQRKKYFNNKFQNWKTQIFRLKSPPCQQNNRRGKTLAEAQTIQFQTANHDMRNQHLKKEKTFHATASDLIKYLKSRATLELEDREQCLSIFEGEIFFPGII